MTELIRQIARRPRALVAPLALLALVALAGLAWRAAARPQPRTIVFIARDMSFWVEGRASANPIVSAAPGEALRLELRNEDPGMAHDLAIPALDRSTRILKSAGEVAALELRAPEEPGDYDYVCSLHGRLMRGQLQVR